ncbi:SGNH/GDSL hydrolase family protein [Nocardioides daeguensis]|uniref:SGNH/GDSL hydrolase family protein n=1 Tax=Nocardioides daeguensis TaxID=908359 RepID=A0ABP6VAR2_9ACTN|nr:SGNH/GDSL hydrolase family protein [Nocardioides daeguensis]MBV6726335.1 SGNH/GDSL hydrolase family protein [Nocardioides daeguensis]MCR1772178.1 SGNH/GDSL hydrolase family protein [Nocardioides daeguensis]
MRRAASLLVVAAVLLAGCSDPPESKISRADAARDGASYVALGDSYAAGPRLGPNTGPVGCEQTKGNYPHLLAERLDLELTDVTCGGATSADLAQSQTPPNGEPVPPQLDALSASTDLVTIGIGGNDGKTFSELMTTCVGKAVKDPDGAPCTAPGASFRTKVERQLGRLPARMVESIEAVRERAPKATVIVVGYPAIFPAAGTCDLLPLARGDYPYARDYVSRINEGLAAAADQAGVAYVDVWTATDGHDICSTDPWIAGLVPAEAGLEYHPYAREQQVVADLLVDELR